MSELFFYTQERERNNLVPLVVGLSSASSDDELCYDGAGSFFKLNLEGDKLEFLFSSF